MLLPTLIRRILLLAVLTGLSGPALARPAAMVSELRGSASSSQKSLQLFDTLEPGQVVVVPAGAALSLSFLEGGLRATLRGPAQFQLQAAGVKRTQGSGEVQLQRPTSDRAPGIRGDFNWDRMAGLRREDLGWIGDRSFCGQDVELRWTSPADLDEVEIVVEQLPDYQRVYKGTVGARPSRLPLKLEAGKSYQCHLRGFSPRRTAEASEWSIRLLSSAEVSELEQRERRSAAGEPVDQLEHCVWLLQQGLQSRAQKLAAELLKKYPEQARLRELAQPE